MAEIGDDEGILGNDFTMAHELTVRPCEGAVYLPDLAGTGKGHMGERSRLWGRQRWYHTPSHR